MVCHPQPQLHPAFPPNASDITSILLFDPLITTRMSVAQHQDTEAALAVDLDVQKRSAQRDDHNHDLADPRNTSALPKIEVKLGTIRRHVMEHERPATARMVPPPDVVDYGPWREDNANGKDNDRAANIGTPQPVRDNRVPATSPRSRPSAQRRNKRQRRLNHGKSLQKDGTPSNTQLEDMLKIPTYLNPEERKLEAQRLRSHICTLSGLDLTVKWRDHQEAGRTEGAIQAIQDTAPGLGLTRELIKAVLVKEIAKTRTVLSWQNVPGADKAGKMVKSEVNNVHIGSRRAALFRLDGESPKSDSVAEACSPDTPPTSLLALEATTRAVMRRELELDENTTLLARARREVMDLETAGCISAGARQEVMRLERHGWELRDSINGLRRTLGDW